MIDFHAFADELVKISAEVSPPEQPDLSLPEDKKKPPHPLLIAGTGVLGLGAGVAAGHATMQGINALLKRKGGEGIPQGVLKYGPPIAGLTGMGASTYLAYTMDRARQAQKEREALDGG